MIPANLKLAAALDEMGRLLFLSGAQRFRVRAYHQAARSVADAEVDVIAETRSRGSVPEGLRGVGPRLSGLISRYAMDGDLPGLEDLQREIPSSLLELLRVPRLSVRRIRILHEQLGIRNLDELRRAAQEHRLAPVRGIGPRVEEEVLHALSSQERRMPFRRADLDRSVDSARRFLRSLRGVRDVIPVGALRRCCDLVPALDFLLVLDEGRALSDLLDPLRHWGRLERQSESRLWLSIDDQLPVHLSACTEDLRAAALLIETGSAAHLKELQERAKARGRPWDSISGKKQEASIYRALGLQTIPPELREGRGEVEAASAGMLPRLVRVEDLKGDLHSHTAATDGRDSLEAMAEAAQARGLSYLAITDHTQSLSITNGQNEPRLRAQMKSIERLNGKFRGFQLLKSAEVDILEDGSLDLPDAVLRDLDLTVCSIHSRFQLPPGQQTDRVLRAMEHPAFRILGHPTGRLLLRRQGHPVDLDRILKAARDLDCILELNAQPDRLDLDDQACRRARESRVLIAISSDAHSIHELDFLRRGVEQARRGWIEAKDVLNSRTLPELLPILRRRTGGT